MLENANRVRCHVVFNNPTKHRTGAGDSEVVHNRHQAPYGVLKWTLWIQ